MYIQAMFIILSEYIWPGRILSAGFFQDVTLLTGLDHWIVFPEEAYAWTAKQLTPSLPERSVAVMDNAAFHKRTDTLNAIRAHGHDVLFLPPYSPDLNPIEKKWAQAKNVRKTHVFL